MAPQGHRTHSNADSPVVRDRRGAVLLGATVVGVGLFFLYFVLGRWFPDSPILELGREDGLVEYAGAAFWAMASGICAYRLLRGAQPRLLLAAWMVLTFVFFGEEISWFQRVLGFGTPDALMEANRQGEFNLHNLELLNPSWVNLQNMFRAGFVAYFLMLPLTMTWSRARAWAALVGYTVPGRAFFAMVWIVVGAGIVLQVLGADEAVRVSAETHESFYAFAVLVYVVFYLRGSPNGGDQDVEADPATSAA